MRVYFAALGCRLNQSETDTWMRNLPSGWQVVSDARDANICILNSCAVTATAAQKSRQLLHRLHRNSPHAKIVLTGCAVDVYPDTCAQWPGVYMTVTTADKDHLVQRVVSELGTAMGNGAPPGAIRRDHAPHGRTRALVKIQDGCDNACSYCVVRLARGHHRSRALPDIAQEVLQRQHEGYQEIVLTGVHIGAYGQEWRESLAHLVDTLLRQTEIPRLRLSSIEPWDLTQELIALWQSPRLCRHMHLPLQSGCDTTLQRMNRRYNSEHYAHLVQAVRQVVPDIAITTDVIVGFPGERDQHFAESIQLVRDMGFARIHTFPFSIRPGTAAALMSEQVGADLIKRRAAAMRAVGRSSSEMYQRRFLGRTLTVLWEGSRAAEWFGLTDNYLRVVAMDATIQRNTITPAHLLEWTPSGIRGELGARPDD